MELRTWNLELRWRFWPGIAPVCVWLLAAPALGAVEKRAPVVRVAVLDLKAPAAAPWLGPAVGEAIAVKLAGVEGVTLLEREKIHAVLTAAKGKEITPKLLGCDFLLSGSVQLVGKWPDEKAQLRLSAKIVAAETAKVKGQAAFIIAGTVGGLFALETQLAEKFAQALGKEPTVLQIEFHEEKNFRTKQLFGEALLLLQRAEKPGVGGKPGAGKAAALLQAAVTKFREAQRQNEGAFYARAHHYEGRVREMLAQAQADDETAKQVRAATVAQFRKDAAEAAPAFYDLGRALEANAEYREAIQAYNEYLKWMKEENKIIRWRQKAHGSWITMPSYFGTNVPHLGGFEYIEGMGPYIVTVTGGSLSVFDRKTHKKLWTRKTPGLAKGQDAHKQFFNGNEQVLARLRGRTLTVYRTATGEQLVSVKLEIPAGPEAARRRYRANQQHVSLSMIYLLPTEAGPYVAVARRAQLAGGEGGFTKSLCVVDLSTKQVAWAKKWTRPHPWTGFRALPQVWNSAFICRTPGTRQCLYLDVTTGQDAAERFSRNASKLLHRTIARGNTESYLLPDQSGQGRYLVQLSGRSMEPVLHLPGPRKKPVRTAATRFMSLNNWWGFVGTHGKLYWTAECAPGEPWLAYNLASRRFEIRQEPLPENRELISKMSARGWDEAGPTAELSGFLRGNRLWWRNQGHFRIYDLARGAKPRLVFEYRNPWRVFSRPVIGADSMHLFISESGLGGCDLVEVGIPKGGRGTVTETDTLWSVAGCRERLGDLAGAVRALKQATASYHNLLRFHEKLITLLERLGRLGEASRECEILVEVLGRQHPRARKAAKTHARLLGQVKGRYTRGEFLARSGKVILYSLDSGLYAARYPTLKKLWRRDLPSGSAMRIQGARVVLRRYELRMRGARVVLLSAPASGKKITLDSIDLESGQRKATTSFSGHWFDTQKLLADASHLDINQYGGAAWLANLPVFVASYNSLVAFHPVTLKRLYTCPVNGYRIAVQRDRFYLVYLGGLWRRRGETWLWVWCRALSDGRALWKRELKLKHRAKRRRLHMHPLGRTLRVYARTRGAGPRYAIAQAFSARTGEDVAWKPAYARDAYWTPHAPARFLDPDFQFEPAWFATKRSRAVHSFQYGGHLWDGGPVLTTSWKRLGVWLIDPHTLKPLCGGVAGLKDGLGGTRKTVLEGELVRSSSHVMGSQLWFDRKKFLRAIGWTAELAAEYRKKYPMPTPPRGVDTPEGNQTEAKPEPRK